jgi:hypothetical protein
MMTTILEEEDVDRVMTTEAREGRLSSKHEFFAVGRCVIFLMGVTTRTLIPKKQVKSSNCLLKSILIPTKLLVLKR